ncbi:DUF2927 domain-containing protein [Sagittula sp. SSi028]|uniref:DUF2927 domain-containing protein n=1 Tax=Sagittula sp. SSi028 TaxID=3400636 RepID=UPI003AF5280F
MTLRRLPCALAVLGLAVLTACETSTLAPRETGVTPQERPVAAPAPAPVKPPAKTTVTATESSRAMAAYYARIQSNLLAQGLLRTDGGGPDTPFTDTMLVRNFAAIALEEEYVRGQGLRPSGANAGSAIKKWLQPVRVTTEFTPNVPTDQRAWDRAEVASFTRRLGQITGHPVSLSDKNPNFHVIFAAQDDHALIADRIREIVPDVNPTALRIFQTIPRGIHCLVMAFAEENGGYAYGNAIAVIRSEHPELMRLSCVHEEMAQGFGLTNDSPSARPTIFNDDDEFALLTRHDELLLQMLYDPALQPGMLAEEALPIARRRASVLTGNDAPS